MAGAFAAVQRPGRAMKGGEQSAGARAHARTHGEHEPRLLQAPAAAAAPAAVRAVAAVGVGQHVHLEARAGRGRRCFSVWGRASAAVRAVLLRHQLVPAAGRGQALARARARARLLAQQRLELAPHRGQHVVARKRLARQVRRQRGQEELGGVRAGRAREALGGAGANMGRRAATHACTRVR